MRLWSIHPKYLDAKGIVALWREALLAQKVLRGKTKGYKHHPQLERFRNSKNPGQSIASYLHEVWQESERRGYSFNQRKILKRRKKIKISVTRGQLKYEFEWLKNKLKKRDPKQFKRIGAVRFPQVHPIFSVKSGSVESWERV